MMTVPPIPLTARVPIPFTPPALSERNAKITEANLDRAEKGLEPLVLIDVVVRVPTMYERDSFAAALVRGGVVHYSRQQVRDLMLAGISYLHDEDQFEIIRGQLEELWQAGDAQQECQALRTDRYVELMEKNDQLPAAKRLSVDDMKTELEAIQPAITISDQKRVRTTAIQQDIVARYAPLQKAFADLAEQDVRRAWLCVEIYVVNWHGLDHAPVGNGRGGLTQMETEYLRAHIGAEAFDQLGSFIFAMHSIDGDEEKNLASLIESSSAPTGSPAAESMSAQASGDGNSTAAPSTPTPAAASRKTTATSSASTKRSGRKTVRSGSGPTAKP